MKRICLVAAMAAVFPCRLVLAQEEELPTEEVVCEYPRVAERLPFASLEPDRLVSAAEAEPNNTAAAAQNVPLGFAAGQQTDVDITGAISPAFDQDWFRFTANGGDTIGVAVLAIDAASLDSIVSIRAANGSVLLENDQHGGIASFYPPQSPFPAGGISRDAALTFAIPTSGVYFVQVRGRGASTGGYLAQMRVRRPPLLATTSGTNQILYLDFDGAAGVHADELFGAGGVHNATLSGLPAFLARWGLAAADRDPLIDEIVANVSSHFSQLLVGTSSQIEIRNSKDHPDPFGQPHVSRVIVGGRISELGIETIGIAEFIDPGNFSTTDTAVVLLDLLSAPATNGNSVLSLPRAPGITVRAAVAHAIACVITHEACHFLGCWHTENGNVTASIIDRGGNLRNMVGVGVDGILGTADDRQPSIRDDNYAFEGVGRSSDIENVRAQVIASLSVGTVTPDVEGAGLEALLAGLEAARQRAGDPEPPPQFTPLDTREVLGLPDMGGPALAPAFEPSNSRYEKAAAAWNARLQALRNQ